MLVYSEDFWLYYQWLKVFSSSWNENYNSQCFYQKKVVAYSHWKERQVIIFLHHGIFYWDAFCSRVFQGIFDNALIILDISWTWKFFLVSTYTSNNLFSLGTSWVSLDAQYLVAPVLTLTLSSIASTLSSLISSTERPYFFL